MPTPEEAAVTPSTKSETQVAFENLVADGRARLLALESDVKLYKDNIFLTDAGAIIGVDKGEVIANIMLSYRHLEDARMRLGKVFQALDGGKSPLTR